MPPIASATNHQEPINPYLPQNSKIMSTVVSIAKTVVPMKSQNQPARVRRNILPRRISRCSFPISGRKATASKAQRITSVVLTSFGTGAELKNQRFTWRPVPTAAAMLPIDKRIFMAIRSIMKVLVARGRKFELYAAKDGATTVRPPLARYSMADIWHANHESSWFAGLAAHPAHSHRHDKTLGRSRGPLGVTAAPTGRGSRQRVHHQIK